MTTALVLLLAVVVAIVGVLLFASSKPDTFRVTRTLDIKAPPDRIFALVNDFRAWRVWSPYENLDPNLKRTYGGAESGEGAAYAWQCDGKAGAGRMEIAETSPPNRILIRLDFTKPFKASNKTEFTFVPAGDATTTTWTMDGKSLFVGKVMGLFMDMDKMVGKDFETGLRNLKAAAEAKPVAALA